MNKNVDENQVRQKSAKWLKMTIFAHFQQEYTLFYIFERDILGLLAREVQWSC